MWYLVLTLDTVTASELTLTKGGCTYTHFLEYDVDATFDDGSCTVLVGIEQGEPTEPLSGKT